MDKGCVKVRLLRDPTTEISDLYEFKIALFDNSDPGKFLLFVRNFQTTLEDSVALTISTNIQYLCMILYGKVLRQLDTLSVEMGSKTMTHLSCNVFGLGNYFINTIVLSKQKCVMHRRIRKPCTLKLRCYADRMVELNEYLTAFTGSKTSEKISETKLS